MNRIKNNKTIRYEIKLDKIIKNLELKIQKNKKSFFNKDIFIYSLIV